MTPKTNLKKQPIIIISGPTGSGKTHAAIKLAKSLEEKEYKPEIINFDSIQFYKELSIGSAKPSKEELAAIKHHLVGEFSITNPIDASQFVNKAVEIIKQAHNKNVIPILVGGSGFYIRALIKGMFDSTHTSLATRELVENIIKAEGGAGIRTRLKEVDIESFNQLHENDIYRNSRSLEHWVETGVKFSEVRKKIQNPYDFSTSKYPSWDIIHFCTHLEKEEHLEIVYQRTQSFFKDWALLKEVQKLLLQGFTGLERPLQSIGYKETTAFILSKNLADETQNIDINAKEILELIEQIFISTRQLIKSQKTFFKKVTPKEYFHPLRDDLTSSVLRHLHKC